MKLLAIISLLFIASCNPAKKLLESQERFEQVGQAWAKKNPCKVDTHTIQLPGTIDSVAYPKPVFDSTAFNIAKDSLQKALVAKYNTDKDDCNRQVSEAFNTGYDQAIYELRKQKAPIKIPGKQINNLVDPRTIDAYKNSEMDALKKLTDQQNNNAVITKQRNVFFFISCFLFLALIIAIVLLIKK